MRAPQRVFEGGKRLLEILFPLSNYGVGARVTRVTWTSPNCYWLITKLKYNKRAVKDDGSIHVGKAWGTLFWQGQQRGATDRRIPGHCKARWELIQEPTGDRPDLAKGKLHRKYYVVADD